MVGNHGPAPFDYFAAHKKKNHGNFMQESSSQADKGETRSLVFIMNNNFANRVYVAKADVFQRPCGLTMEQAVI
eukprot:c35934_g1_i1 orf=36-257(+)